MRVSRSASPPMPDLTSSACRSFASCGSRKAFPVRRSVAARSPTTTSTWATRTWAQSRSAARIQSAGPAQDTPSRRAIFVCHPRSQTDEQHVRHHDPVENRASRIPSAGDEGGSSGSARVLRPWPAGWPELRCRDPARARTGAGRSGFPAARVSRSIREGRGVSPERSRARVAALVLPVEQRARRAPARSG